MKTRQILKSAGTSQHCSISQITAGLVELNAELIQGGEEDGTGIVNVLPGAGCRAILELMPRVTEIDIRVRSTDMDADNIVNNARYFEYFEQARLEHLIALGIIGRPRRADGTEDRAFTIAETTCRYRAPLRHRETVTVRCWTSEVHTRSFSLAYEIVKKVDGSTAAEGSSALVWLDDAGKPTALNEDERSALEAFL